MIGFLLAEGNFPFAVALAVMAAIGVLEGLAILLGSGLSSLIDPLLPEVDVDADVDLDGGAGVADFLGWLHVGRVPILILLVAFLTAFGLAGLAVQGIARFALGSPLPAIVASLPAFVAALPAVRIFGAVLARIFPQDETDAVSEESFVGRMAVITLGNASADNSAEAKLRDEYGTTHYVRVLPEIEDEVLPAGSPIILVRKEGATFYAIQNTHN